VPGARLLLALGNPLMGDDGVAWHLARVLEADPRLPADVEVAWGGTDLLRCAEMLEGRRQVVLLDAMEGDEAGEVVELDPWSEGLDDAQTGPHGLSAVAALRLLAAAAPGHLAADVRLLGVTVTAAAAGEGLSPALEARLGRVAEGVLAALASDAERPGGPPAAT
jgi:hydrogenase maturation protease